MKKKKIIFVTKYFLPAIGGGLRRIEALYRIFLKRKDIDLSVVTATDPKNNKYKNVNYIKQLFFKDRANNKNIEFRNSKTKIKFFDKAMIGWMPIVLLKLIFKKYDYIFSTCPVFTNVVIGYLYKIIKFNKPKLIIEYRDLYSFNPSYLNNFKKKLINIFEIMILKKADYIITTTEGMKNIISKRIDKNKITVIRNYISMEDYTAVKKNKKEIINKRYFNIGYIGKLNTGRDPSKFINLLKYKISKKSVALHFVGVNEAEKKFIFEKALKLNLNEDRLFFYNNVDRNTSLKFMKNMDALLLIINNDVKIFEGYGIPGKLFDYAMINNNIFSDSKTINNLSSEFDIKISKRYGDFVCFSIRINETLNDKINNYLDDIFYERKN
jgi:hypothetical protein